MVGRDTEIAGGLVGPGGADVGPGTAASDEPALPPGTVIDGRYRLVQEIGAGGMGRVYEAEHMFLRRRMALKLLRGGHGRAEAAARMVQEATLAGQVPHPAIVRVFDCADLGAGRVYLAMELLRGETLEQALRRGGPTAAVVRWLADVARGLAAAHRVGVVHRDVKPANIFLARDEAGAVQAKLLDFGVAKLLPGAAAGEDGVRTQAGAVLGTPHYLAPEQARGAALDGRADLYSLGVILYEALTGELPFVGESFVAILAQHLRAPPLDPRQAAPGRAIPDRAARLTMRLLAKDPAMRPDDGDALAGELAAVLAAEGEALARLATGAHAGAAGRLAEGTGAGTVRLAEGAGDRRLAEGTGAETVRLAEGTGDRRLAEGTGAEKVRLAEGTGDRRLAEETDYGAVGPPEAPGAGPGGGATRLSSRAGSAASGAGRRVQSAAPESRRRFVGAGVLAAIASAAIGWATVRARRGGVGGEEASAARGAGVVAAPREGASAGRAGGSGPADGGGDVGGAGEAAGAGGVGGTAGARELGARELAATVAVDRVDGEAAAARPEKPARGGRADKKSPRDGGTTRTPRAPVRVAGDPPLKPDVYDE